MRKTVILIIIFNCFYINVIAQQLQNSKPSDTASTWQLFKYDTNNTWKGIKHAVTRPIHWNNKDLTKFGGLVIGSAILSISDESTSDFFRRQEGNFPQPIQEFGLYFGHPQNYLLANAGLYGFGLFTKNEAVRKTSVLIISSSITTGYIQIISRSIFGRARPLAERGAHTFKPFSNESEFLSFPSGHTVFGMTMAHAIAKQFDSPWTKAGIYTIGSIPGFSRLLNGKHWLTDVAFSTIMSIVVVDSIDKLFFESEAYYYPKKEKTISWSFRFSGNQIGFIGTF